MAQNQTSDWYPTAQTPQSEKDRIIFDNLYYLRSRMGNNNASELHPSSMGMSATVTFKDANNNAVSLVIGGKTFSSLTFANGILVSTK